MKKMCPMRYLYHVLIFLLTHLLLVSCTDWKAYFDPNPVLVTTAGTNRVRLVLSDLPDDVTSRLRAQNSDQDYIQLVSEDDNLATVKNQNKMVFFEVNRTARSWDTKFNVDGVFLGKKKLFL
jgi:hypothetical protein